MNGTPLVNTTAAGLTTVQVGQLIAWLAASIGLQMPEGVSYTIAAGIIVAGHALYKAYAAKVGLPPEPETPAVPAA